MNRPLNTTRRLDKYIHTLLRARSYVALLLPAILVLSCGGGGHSVAGIDGSGAPLTSTSGTVNGFGSVIVNGVRYHSDKAKILVNDEVADENSLRTGYQVRVTGTLNSDGTGNANTIEFNPTLVGIITAIDTQYEQLELLGQTVQITNTTLFDAAIAPNNLGGLNLGTRILVSGQRNSEGLVAATRIELALQNTYQLAGSIGNINLANHTFTLNNLTVNYTAAAVKNNGNDPLKNGATVTVAGDMDSAGVLRASSVSVQTINFGSDVKTADIEGFVTRFASATDFELAGVACSTASATVYNNGSSAALALGSSLKVSGKVNVSGVLVAEKVEFRQRVINEINGQVSSVSTPAAGAIATGNFIIAGTSIQTNSSTAYEDGSNDRLKRFSFVDIRQGNFLKVSGYTNQTGFIATKIERKVMAGNNELRYEGVVTQVADHSFTVYGQTIAVTGTSLIRSASGTNLSEEEFLAQALNKHVRVRGTLVNNLFTAIQIEIRPEYRDDFHRPQDGGGHGDDSKDGGEHPERSPQEDDNRQEAPQNSPR